MGSSSLVKILVSLDMVDEYRLMIEPIILGRLSKGGSSPTTAVPSPLKLASAVTSRTGVLICKFVPA